MGVNIDIRDFGHSNKMKLCDLVHDARFVYNGSGYKVVDIQKIEIDSSNTNGDSYRVTYVYQNGQGDMVEDWCVTLWSVEARAVGSYIDAYVLSRAREDKLGELGELGIR